MAASDLQDEPLTCPTCGGPVEHVSALDGSGTVALCPKCSSGPTPVDEGIRRIPTPPPSPAPKAPDPVKRFRNLTTPADDGSETLPEELLEDLPEEARQLLQPGAQQTKQPPTEELREDFAASLRAQGYVIEQDARGVRISGELSSRHGETGPMSPYDVVRMAADLEGGVLPPEKRRHCPKCDAAVPADATRCPWCSETLPPAAETSEPQS